MEHDRRDQPSIVVSQPTEADSPRRPAGPIVLGVAVLSALAVFGVGRIGEPPATDDVTQDTASVELSSVPTAAPTTTLSPEPTSTTRTSDLPEPVQVSAEELAAEPRWEFSQLALPDGFQVVSHLTSFRGDLMVFGPTSAVGEFPQGLQMLRWTGSEFQGPVEVAPPSESVLSVASGDLGLLVVTARTGGSDLFFGSGSLEPTTIRTSVDGVAWTEIQVPETGAGLQQVTAVVGAEEAWLVGFPRADEFDRVVGALPAPYPDLVRDGLLTPVTLGPDELGLFTAGFPTRVAAFDFDDLGIGELDLSVGAQVALRTTDMSLWQEATLPPDDLDGAFGANPGLNAFVTNADGDVYANAGPGVWRSRDGRWELAFQATDLGVPLFNLALIGDIVVGQLASASTAGPEFVRFHPLVGHERFAVAMRASDTTTPPVGGRGAAVFSFMTGGEPPGLVDVARFEDGSSFEVDLSSGTYRYVDASGAVAATFEVFGEDSGMEFDPSVPGFTLLDAAGELLAVVSLSDIRQGFQSGLGSLSSGTGSLLMTDGARFREVTSFGDGQVGAITALAAFGDRFAVAEGLFLGRIPSNEASRLFIGGPADG